MKNADVQASLVGIINDILSVKSRLQQEVPVRDASFSRHDEAGKELITLHEQVKKLVLQLGLIEEIKGSSTVDSAEPAPVIDEESLLLLCGRNAVLEKIKSLQSVFLDVVVTGGPLEAKHYKELNPSLPDQALRGIERKIEKTLANIKSRAEGKHLAIIIVEAGDKSDALLASSTTTLRDTVGIDTRVLEIPSIGVGERELVTLLAGVINR